MIQHGFPYYLKNLGKEAMHFFGGILKQGTGREGGVHSICIASSLLLFLHPFILQEPESHITIQSSQVLKQHLKLTHEDMYRVTKNISVAPDKKRVTRRYQEQNEPQQRKTFLFTILHGLLICVSSLVDVLTHWWVFPPSSADSQPHQQACQTQVCQPSAQEDWQEQQNFYDSAALRKLISSSGSGEEQSPRTSACTALHCLGCRPHFRGNKPKRAARKQLTDRFRLCAVGAVAACFGHSAATLFCAVATAGARRRRHTLATLSLLVQFLPLGPVGSDHVKHWLKFRIQLDQSLQREGGEQKNNRSTISMRTQRPLMCYHYIPFTEL